MKVILTTVDQTRGKIFFLSSTDKVGQAKTLWANEEKCDIDSFVLASGANFVNDDVMLEEVPHLYPGITELFVDEKVLLPVRAFGMKNEPKALLSALSMRAEELYDTARDLFGITEGHVVRFRLQDQVLAGERTLRESGIDAASGVDVEVGWQATVQRVSGCEEIGVFFSQVLKMVASPQLRVLCSDRILRSAADIEELLLNAFEGSAAVRLVLEESSPVLVLSNGEVESETVWPTEGLRPEGEVMLQDKLMARGAPQLLPPWLLHCAPLRLVTVLINGSRTVLRVPRDGAVSDVLDATYALNGRRRKLQVLLGSRELEPHVSLQALGLQDGSQLRLRCPPTTIRVRVGELQLSWELPRSQDCATFGEIVAGISPGNPTQKKALLRGLLVCEDCGRQLSLERQAFQSVPASCCELKSMRLRFALKTSPKDAAVQTIPRLGMNLPQSMMNTESQIDQKTSEVAVQTEVAKDDGDEQQSVKDAAVQTIPRLGMNLPQSMMTTKSKIDQKVLQTSEVAVQTEVAKDDGDEQQPVKDGPVLVGSAFLRLPDGGLIICGTDKSPKNLLDALRQKRLLFRIDNLTKQGQSLISKGWMKRTLQESGVADGDEISVKTLPLSIMVAVDESGERFKAMANFGRNSWDQIQSNLSIANVETMNIVYLERLYYLRNGESRSAVKSCKDGRESKEDLYLDEEDGGVVKAEDGSKYVWEFLTPTQRLLSVPTGSPTLRISTGDVFGCKEISNGTTFVALPSEAVFDPQYIALIFGFRYFSPDKKKATRHIVLPTRNGKFVFMAGGKSCNDIEEVRGKDLVKKLTERRMWVLLRENDLIPHWKYPRDLVINLYRREGVDLQVVNERLLLQETEAASSVGSCWIMPRDADDLDEKFCKVVRLSRRKDNEATMTK